MPVQAGVQAVEVVQVAVEGAQEGGPPANVGEQHFSVLAQAGLQAIETVQVAVEAAQ